MKKAWYFVTLGLAGITPKGLVSKIRTCVTMMTDNEAFMAPNPVPDPSLETMRAIADNLDAADQAYEFNRGKLEKDTRDTYFQEAKTQFHLLGGYVQLASGGVKEIILTAGLDVERNPTAAPVPEAPPRVRAASTRVLGQIIVRYGASKGRLIYKIYRTEGDPALETGWVLVGQTGKVRFVVDGLDRFKTYGFRVVAVGAAGASIPSDVAVATAA